MNEVICQTKFDTPFGEEDAGISVYIANLNPEAEYTISVRIGDTVKIVTASEDDKTVTDRVSFYGLRKGEAYKVECGVYSKNEINTFCATMYAQYSPDPLSFHGKPGGGTLRGKSAAPKVEVL